MIQAFGVARFTLAHGAQKQKQAPQMIAEVNEKLTALGLTGENVINILFDEEFYHVFYYRPKKAEEAQSTTPQV